MGFVDRIRSHMIIQNNNTVSSPRVSVLDAASSSSKRDPLKTIAKKIGLSFSGDGREFLPPEVDLVQVENAYDAEAYVRQGVDKYIDKMFKAGWTFSGKNPQTVEYIKLRFAMMAEVTQLPMDKFFMEYTEDVVKFSNAIAVKARMKDQSQLPPGLTIAGVGGKEPIVGYFLLNATTMTVRRDKFGSIKQWQQEVEGQDKAIKFKAEDIIHTYYKRKKGHAFGVPFVTPVLDDIRALRQAEDNVLKMLYRNINPFYHISIGSEDLPGDDEEIEAAKYEVEGMELDGGLVTSERWHIDSIAADKVIDSNQYLKYFEDRVFTGLGVPATMFGRGATANKATSDNMDNEFIDRVKAFQRVVEADVNGAMTNELLMEGGYDPVLNPDDMVYFKFNEIDLDMQIKLENQAIYKYEHSAITEDEMRQLLGLDPITDRSKMFAQITGKNTNEETGTAETNNKVNPTNKKKKKGKDNKTSDSIVRSYLEHMEELHDSVLEKVNEFYNGDKYALVRIKSDVFFKKYQLNEITDMHVYNSESVNYIKQVTENLLNELLEEILDSITSLNKRSGAGQYACEMVSSAFKTLESTMSTSVGARILQEEDIDEQEN